MATRHTGPVDQATYDRLVEKYEAAKRVAGVLASELVAHRDRCRCPAREPEFWFNQRLNDRLRQP
jgi:hypothetical protein